MVVMFEWINVGKDTGIDGASGNTHNYTCLWLSTSLNINN